MKGIFSVFNTHNQFCDGLEIWTQQVIFCYAPRLPVQFHYNGCRNKIIITLALYLEDPDSNISPESG